MIGSVLGLLITVGIPVGAAVYFLVRKDGSVWFFAAGIGAFVVTQLLIRIPLLQYLGKNWEWYMLLPYNNLVLYFAFQGITAGLFEETGRWIGFRCVGRKQRTFRWIDGLAFGLGHGGVEAVWVGVSGILPALMAGNVDWTGLIAGAERLFAMMIQIGLSFVVLTGVKRRQPRYWVLAVVLHGLVDFLLILGNVWIVEGLVAVEGIAALVMALRIRKQWDTCPL